MNHNLRQLALTAAVAVAATTVAWADVDQSFTQGGSSMPSGTWRESLVNAADDLLLKFNNDITYDIAFSLDPTSVLDYVPLQDQYHVGEIMYAMDDDTRMIYDRLAVRAVVHIIGYHPGDLPYDDVDPVMLLTENNDLLGAMGPMSLPAGSGRLPSVAPTPSTRIAEVPEPSTVALNRFRCDLPSAPSATGAYAVR
jgi:hypothetical protein